MSAWWTPIWSTGAGPNRIYCGIARTEEGFAVDLFRGDTCIESVVYDGRAEALREAAAFERQYAPAPQTPRAQPRIVPGTDSLAAHG